MEGRARGRCRPATAPGSTASPPLREVADHLCVGEMLRGRERRARFRSTVPPTCWIWRRAEQRMHPDEEERGCHPLVAEGTAPVGERDRKWRCWWGEGRGSSVAGGERQWCHRGRHSGAAVGRGEGKGSGGLRCEGEGGTRIDPDLGRRHSQAAAWLGHLMGR
uniref:Uncharacterized protein n=1 Tax=Oryza rufipogon TaxID=4529 RepID=A0A0E0PYD2_ORYRU